MLISSKVSPSLLQVIVSTFLPNKTHLHQGSDFFNVDNELHALLNFSEVLNAGGSGGRTGLGLDRKFDFTYGGEGDYLRGKWLTIAKFDRKEFELAEIRVCGSKLLETNFIIS